MTRFNKVLLILAALSVCSTARAASIVFIGEVFPHQFQYGIQLDALETLTVLDGDELSFPSVFGLTGTGLNSPLTGCFDLGPPSLTSASFPALPGGCVLPNPDPAPQVVGAFEIDSAGVLGTIAFTSTLGGVTVNDTIAGPVEASEIPEPSSWALLSGGGFMLRLLLRRRKPN